MEYDIAFIRLIVDDWIQSISHKSEMMLIPHGASMCAHCHAVDDFQLTLSTEERITQIPIEVNLSAGPMTRGDRQPLERGIGLFNYISTKEVRPLRPPSVIGCYLGFDLEHYNEIWAQVHNGTFSSCTISLDLASFPVPGEKLWKIEDNRASLFVVGAAIHFKYARPRTK